MSNSKRRSVGFARVIAALVLLDAALIVAISSAASAASVSRIHRGGSITDVAVASQWPGLDPATNTQDAADAAYEDSIFGELFEEGPGGTIVPDQASGYKFIDHGLALEIFLHPGIKFSDGTAFTAQAVESSIERDLIPSNACICLQNFEVVQTITTVGKYTVVLHLKNLYSPIISAFIGQAPDWTVDPTALAQKGEVAYAQDPIGAGPFEVVSNEASATLVLKRNPHYFIKGEPYLNSLTFTAASNDQAGYASVESGQTQAETGVSTISLIQQVKQSHAEDVVASPATGYEFITFNTLAAPFNNILAREAVSYATDTKSIISSLYDNFYKPVETPSAPGDRFYEQDVPGYRTYNLAKAKALVQQIGGLSITLGTLSNTTTFETEASALANQWAQAGIQTKIVLNTLQECLQQLGSHDYQAIDLQWGEGIDNGIALPNFWSSTGPWTGIDDSTIDGLLNQGVSYANSATRAKVYDKINARISLEQYDVFLYSHGGFSFLSKDVEGITDAMPEVHWEAVWLK